MTTRLPFTQANLLRRIEAVRKAGLHVAGITSDGTVLTVENAPGPLVPGPAAITNDNVASKWEDVQA